MKIYAIRGNEIGKPTIIASLVGGIAMIYIGISSSKILVVLVGLLLPTTLLIRRPVYVDENGLNQVIDFRIFKSLDLWKFSEMAELHWIYLSEVNETNIYFEKKGMPKMFSFKPEDAEEVIRMGKEANPNMIIDEVKNVE